MGVGAAVAGDDGDEAELVDGEVVGLLAEGDEVFAELVGALLVLGALLLTLVWLGLAVSAESVEVHAIRDTAAAAAMSVWRI